MAIQGKFKGFDFIVHEGKARVFTKNPYNHGVATGLLGKLLNKQNEEFETELTQKLLDQISDELGPDGIKKLAQDSVAETTESEGGEA